MGERPTLREVIRMTYAMVDLYCGSLPRDNQRENPRQSG